MFLITVSVKSVNFGKSGNGNATEKTTLKQRERLGKLSFRPNVKQTEMDL